MAASLEISSLGHEMEDMMRSNDNGIHKCFIGGACGTPSEDRYGGVMVTFGGTPHPARQGVCDHLFAFKGRTEIKHLLPFQVEAVLNMVFRPTMTSVIKTIVRTYAENSRLVQEGANVLVTPDDDIGMVAINDLFTGSGKTLTTILGAILFADKRQREIVGRVPFLMREQSYANWAARVQCPMSTEQKRPATLTPKYTNVVVVMCAKHLFSQWKSACASALDILGMEGVSVLENPLPGSAELGQDQNKLKIVLLHSAQNLFRLELEFVPVVVVDEFTIKSASNVLTKASELLPLFGRLLLVSADAGSIDRIIFGAHRRSFLRKMIKWDDITYRGDVHISMVAGIPLISASVLQTVERFMVGEFMIDQLKKVRYEKFTVKYTPSFASRLFGNNFEMSAVSGNRLISDMFGIVLTGTKTVGQLLRIVNDTVNTRCATDAGSRMIPPLMGLRDKLRAFVGEKEACPICLEDYEMASGASLINPCWHIVCDKCLRGLMAAKHRKCPMCRTRMEGHTTALIDDASPESGEAQEEASVDPEPNLSLLGNLNAVVKPKAGLEKACIDTLRCIRADVGCQTYKIVMIVPDEHFFTKFAVDVREVFDASEIQIIEFKTSGTKRKHVTGKMVDGQLQSFASDRGPPTKILFTTEGKTDSLTGLDFPRVDCIISLGDGNSLQRLGRLTRLPRMMDEAVASKTVRYICMEPVA